MHQLKPINVPGQVLNKSRYQGLNTIPVDDPGNDGGIQTARKPNVNNFALNGPMRKKTSLQHQQHKIVITQG